jgi:DNA-binding MarR family transcriptional regulator
MAVIQLDGLQPGQLAEITETGRATVTGLIDRMERDGWVERRTDSDDRRTLRVWLSPKAREHQDSFVTLYNEINGSFIRRFSPEARKQLQRLLKKLE